ncbi:hypothetical protein N8488_02185, partial [Akkermansiaceae bacterium]|nr:hypothetical protein [Akkermansiaceae bacterium]
MITKPFISPFFFTVAVSIILFWDTQSADADPLDDAIISEFLADNSDGIVDEDGDREDWIEIWNTSGKAGD